jgi:hypothetical protein
MKNVAPLNAMVYWSGIGVSRSLLMLRLYVRWRAASGKLEQEREAVKVAVYSPVMSAWGVLSSR